jgi:methylmalonyl-CoA/ethylmalonyl-CoA epimerase
MVATSLQKIGQIAVPVKNLDQAITFYKDVLGLPLLFSMNGLAFFECNGVRLLLSVPEEKEFANCSSILYFQVDNLEDTYNSLLEKGVTFTDEPHLVAKVGETETWMAFFKDTEGNTHSLMSEVVVSSSINGH